MAPLHLTLSQVVEGFLLDKRISLKPTTYDNYQWALAKLTAHFDGDPLLADIEPHDITDMLEHLGTTAHKPHGPVDKPRQALSKRSLRNIHAVLSSLWTWAVAEGYTPEHIIRHVSPPRPEERAIVPFTEDDIRAMLAACDESQPYTRPGKRECTNARPTALRDRAMILLFLDTGVRVSELCDIEVQDVDWQNHRLTVLGKRSKERTVQFGRRASKEVWRYLASRANYLPTDPLFVSDEELNEPLNRFAVHKLIRRLGERAGITPDAHPHRFRHTFAINFLRNEGDIFSLKALLGHSSLKTVQQYLAISQVDTVKAHKRASPVDNWKL